MPGVSAVTAFAGIDYDTFGVHVVILPEEGLAEYHHFALGDSEYPFDRARDVRPAMPARGWWDDVGVVAIGIEEQASGSPKMRGTVQLLKMVQGAILSCLPRETLVMPFLANQWRTEVELPGNAKKPEVAAWVHEQRESYLENSGTCKVPQMELVELEPWPQDAADAYCIARAVEKLTVTS